MTTEPEPTTPSAGRPVTLTPVPPGVWLIIGGSVVAALGPLFGFLIGSVLGSTTDMGNLSPIYLFLFGGLAVGGTACTDDDDAADETEPVGGSGDDTIPIGDPGPTGGG